MGYKKLSEYQAKKLYYRNRDYFIDYLNKNKLDLDDNYEYVIKVDNGTKHRFHNGLVKIGLNKLQCIQWIRDNDLDCNYVVEYPIRNIVKEVYVMIRSNGLTDQLIINENGGINLDNPELNSIKIEISLGTTKLNTNFSIDFNNILDKLYEFYVSNGFVYMEVNPLVLLECGEYIPLDFAILIDCDHIEFLDEYSRNIINLDYLKSNNKLTNEELAIIDLDSKTGGSLKFRLLNPYGDIWTLIAGGGASVVYTDTIISLGYKNRLANYGEYSGDPNEELVIEYCNNIFKLMGKTTCNKILFIGGGIANFTDVATTFSGIIKSIHKNYNVLLNTVVWIRRGGPNYKNGLDSIKKVLDMYKISNYVYGPEKDLVEIVKMALPVIENFTLKKMENSLDSIVPNFLEKENLLVKNLDFGNETKCILYGLHTNAIQRMLDFDYVCGKTNPSVVGVVNPTNDSNHKKLPFFYGNNAILLDVYNSLDICVKHHSFNTVICFSSYRSSYTSVLDILNYNNLIKNIIIIAEGIPERYARLMGNLANKLGVNILGPSSVGGILGGEFKIANTGGNIDNIIASNLYKKGHISFVSRSGGLLNELCNIISKNSSGVCIGLSIGGDRWPCLSFLDIILYYEKDPNTKIIMLLGEIGGIEEIRVAQAVKNGLITKPIIGWCCGISAEYLDKNIQFGHAGASATEIYESAIFKNNYMCQNGILVPSSFNEIGSLLNEVYISLDKSNWIIDNRLVREIKDSRKLPSFYSSISNENGDILKYNNIEITKLLDKGIGKTIGHLWLKLDLPTWFCNFIELILIVCADHGGMVSGAHNTMVASRAGKDLVSSLCSGLLTIGDRFGGALNQSAKQFRYANKNGLTPKQFIDYVKNSGNVIMGIGHKIKSAENPDERVSILKNYIFTNFPSHNYVDFALEVEKLTLQKRNNLILNVDGLIANALLDAFIQVMTTTELDQIIESEFINAFFILSRTIGFIGHWYDQHRLCQGLFRLDKNDISYLC